MSRLTPVRWVRRLAIVTGILASPHKSSRPLTAGRTCQTLIFDGDDPLWENNVSFERAIDNVVAYLDRSTLSPAAAPTPLPADLLAREVMPRFA